jgi:DNA transformation protein
MFGEYGLYCDGKMVALVCDDQLFVKPTAAGKTFIGKVREGLPYPGAKPWFLIGGDRCEDSEWLSELVRLTERELPAPKPKPVKKAKAKPKATVNTKTKAKTKATSNSARSRHSSRPKS